MPDLCTVEDVEALSGVPVAPEDEARVARLIAMASDLVGRIVVLPSGPVPPAVSMVTAGSVVRGMANPTGLVAEGIAGYTATYGAGMALTEADYKALGPWLIPGAGQRALTVGLERSSPAVWPVTWWQQDLDAWPWRGVA